jgi:hypothetical protein
MIRTRIIAALALVLLSALSNAVCHARVIIKREPANIEYKTFDRAHPPEDMPHLDPGEDAVTVASFRCLDNAEYELFDHKRTDDGIAAIVDVRNVTFTLQLHVVVWLPPGVSAKLKAHEEGHRKIAEMIYKDRALTAAKAAGAIIDGKRFTATAADLKTAVAKAINAAMQDAGQDYLKRTTNVADAINNAYDQITGHGLKKIGEDDAIREAFAQVDATSNTRPTTQSENRRIPP